MLGRDFLSNKDINVTLGYPVLVTKNQHFEEDLNETEDDFVNQIMNIYYNQPDKIAANLNVSPSLVMRSLIKFVIYLIMNIYQNGVVTLLIMIFK